MFEDRLWFSSSYIGKREVIPEIAITFRTKAFAFFWPSTQPFPGEQTTHRAFLWTSPSLTTRSVADSREDILLKTFICLENKNLLSHRIIRSPRSTLGVTMLPSGRTTAKYS
jgi:hypothetical protein